MLAMIAMIRILFEKVSQTKPKQAIIALEIEYGIDKYQMLKENRLVNSVSKFNIKLV